MRCGELLGMLRGTKVAILPIYYIKFPTFRVVPAEKSIEAKIFRNPIETKI